MLTFEVMGVFALGVMWLSTTLILAVAVSDAVQMYRRSRTAAVAGTLGLVGASCAGILTAAAGVTALALTPPYFGTWSTAGGALGIVFFLLVQPLGVILRRRMQLDRSF